jgi:hypothetical protein
MIIHLLAALFCYAAALISPYGKSWQDTLAASAGTMHLATAILKSQTPPRR